MSKPNINKRNSIIKYCSNCHMELNSLNWSFNRQKNKVYICNNCQRERVNKCCKLKDYAKKYRERNKIKIKDYHRQHWIKSIDSDGKPIMIKTNKRLYPLDSKCEICNKEKNKLDYHHWDDLHPENGMWICSRCHMGCNALETNPLLQTVYQNMKEKIKNHEC